MFKKLGIKKQDDDDSAYAGKNEKKKLKNRKLPARQQHAEMDNEEHADMDKTCFRRIKVPIGPRDILNGAKVHEAVRKHFRIHSAQSIIIHDATDPRILMDSHNDSTISPPPGLWVLVLKCGERRAELGNLCIIRRRAELGSGSDVQLWESIGALSMYAKENYDADMSLVDENDMGFIIRLMETVD